MAAERLPGLNIASSGDDELSWVTGMVTLSNNRLVIVDHRNDSVNLVYTHTGTLLSVVRFRSAPFDVTVVGKDQVAVTQPYSHKITFLNVTDTLTKEREILVDGVCYNCAYSKGVYGDNLVVVFKDPAKVEVMDLYGNVFVRLPYPHARDGMHPEPQLSCVANSDGSIYLADWTLGTIAPFSLSGIPTKPVYASEELIGTKTFCTDHNRCMYVCDIYKSTVCVISANGSEVKHVLSPSDGLSNGVWSMCHCKYTNRLFIGQYRMEGSDLLVFQLQPNTHAAQ